MMIQGLRTRELATEIDAENPTLGDWRIENGQLSWLAASDPKATAQAISRRLLTYRGEVFADQRRGFPWFQQVLGRRGAIPRLQSLLRRAIAGTPGVRSCKSVSYSVDRQLRSIALAWSATFDDGKQYVSADFDTPYILVMS